MLTKIKLFFPGIILLLLFCFDVKAVSPKLGSYYTLNTQVNLSRCKKDGTIFAGESQNINAGIKIRFCNKLKGDNYVISVARYPDNDAENNRLVYAKIAGTVTYEDNITGNILPDDTYTVLYFLLPKDDLQYIDTIPQRLTFQYVNITSLPGKLRFGAGKKSFTFPDGGTYTRQFSVEGSLNLGYAIGGQVRLDRSNKFFFNFIGGVNVGSISVDSASTDGKANGNTKTALAISPFVGAYLQYGNVQVGLLTGIDFPTGKIGQDWIWRYQPWLGIGVGVSIFAPPSKTSTTQTSTQSKGK